MIVEAVFNILVFLFINFFNSIFINVHIPGLSDELMDTYIVILII